LDERGFVANVVGDSGGGRVSATVTARPVALVFDPGNGGVAVSCDGPGRPWTSADGNGAPTDGACAYRYMRVTTSPITSTQTIVWKITWTGTGGTGGQIPSLSTSTSGRLQVLQIQVVNR
jgi:enoyl reductase